MEAGSAGLGRPGAARPGQIVQPDARQRGTTRLTYPAVSDRMRRVNESVRAVVAEGIAALKDPRIGLVTVTGVHVTSDLQEATVYVSVLGNQRKRVASLAGLESARGVLQARINRELKLRRTPTVSFSYDSTAERAAEMTKLIEDVTADLPEREAPPDDG